MTGEYKSKVSSSDKSVREKTIEQKFVKAVKASGGMCPKLVSPGLDGMPDRMVLMPGGHITFVEVKAPGKEPRPLQLHRIEDLRRLGFRVFILDHPGQIPAIIEEARHGAHHYSE